MTWQQWTLLIWFSFRIPFGIHREVTKPKIKEEMTPKDVEKTIVIGILTYLVLQATLIALVVTI